MHKKGFWVNIISRLLILSIGLVGTWLIWTSFSSITFTNNKIEQKRLLGQQYIINDDLIKAEECFEEIIDINYNNVEAKIGLAIINALDNKYQQAEKLTLEAIEEDAKNPLYYKLLGILLFGESRFSEATEQLLKAQECSTNDKGQYNEIIGKIKSIEEMNKTGNDISDLSNETRELIMELLDEWLEITQDGMSDRMEVLTRYINIENEAEKGDIEHIEDILSQVDFEYLKEPLILKAVGKAYMMSGNTEKAMIYLENSYEIEKNEETAVLLAEIWDNLYVNKQYEIFEGNRKIKAVNDSIRKKIINLERKVEKLNPFDLLSIEKINKYHDEIEELHQEINNTYVSFIEDKIKRFLDDTNDSVYLQEKLAKLYYFNGETQEAEKIIDILLDSISENNKEDKNLAALVKGTGVIYDANISSKELLLNYNKEIVSFFNKYVPDNWLKKQHNKEWSNYFTSYLSYRDGQVHIVKIDTEKYPMVTAHIRINGLNDIKKLIKKDFEIYDTGNQVIDFQVVKEADFDNNIIVLLDHSESMEGERLKNTKKSAVEFVNMMAENDKILIAIFDDKLNIITDFLPSNQKEILIDAINSTPIGGKTDIYGSINGCLDILNSKKGRKSIVILSDGEDDEKDGEVIEKAKKLGIPVFSIGLKSGYKTLQEISYKTGGEFFYTNDSNRLNVLYSMIKKQIDKEYRINYKVRDEEKEVRQLKISIKKRNLSCIKHYSTDPKIQLDEYQYRRILLNAIVYPNYLYENNSSSVKSKVKVSFDKYNGTEDIKISYPVDVYINSYRINEDLVTYEEGSLSFKLPSCILSGTYDIRLQDKVGAQFIVQDAFTIMDNASYGSIKLDNLNISGDISQYSYSGISELKGTYTINDLINIEGVLHFDSSKKRVYGEGRISTNINSIDEIIHYGRFDLDAKSLNMYLESNKSSKLSSIYLNLNRLDIFNDYIKLYGTAGIRMSDNSITWANIDSFTIGDNKAKITLNNFEYSNEIFNIKNGILEFVNENWIGNGEVYVSNPSLNIITNGEFEINLDKNRNSYYLNDVSLKFNKDKDYDLVDAVLNITPVEGLITNSFSSFPKIVIKGKGEYNYNNYDETMLSPLIGDVELSLGSANEIYSTVVFKNSILQTSLEGFVSNDRYYGHGSVRYYDDIVGELQGEGRFSISSKGMYGVFHSKFNEKEEYKFKIIEDLIVLEDVNKFSKAISFSGMEYNSHDLDVNLDINIDAIISSDYTKESSTKTQSKLQLKNAYRIKDNLVLEPNLDILPSLCRFRIYEVKENGKNNLVNYRDFEKQDVIVINNILSDIRLRIVGYNLLGEEIAISDIIETSEIIEENPIVNIQWIPNKDKINSKEVTVKINFITNDESQILLNSKEIITIKESQDVVVEKLTEGHNEILVQSKNNYLFNEIWKDYIVDSRPPILHLDNILDNIVCSKKTILVSGRTDPTAMLVLNGEKTQIGENGDFAKRIKLSLGENKIIITSQDNAGNVVKYNGLVKFYGSSYLYIILAFLILYIITIITFVIVYKRKKREIFN